jgi:hypothetical protein
MESRMKLEDGHRRILMLCRRDANPEGWANVSRQIMPLLTFISPEFVEIERSVDGSGKLRLTEKGKTVLDWT